MSVSGRYSATSTHRGHKIRCPLGSDKWVYSDSGQSVKGSSPDCALCAKGNTRKGHDPCIANLPGVMNACCGHGQKGQAYVQFENGLVIRGDFDHVKERK